MQKELCEKLKTIYEEIISSYKELDDLLLHNIDLGIKILSKLKHTKENAEAVMETARAIEKFLQKINKIEYRLEKVTDKTQIFLGNIKFKETKWKQMPKSLENISGTADFTNSQIKDLGRLKIIANHVDFRSSKVTELGQLQKVGGYVDFTDSLITNLGMLEEIGQPYVDKNSRLDFTKVKHEAIVFI